MVNVEGLDVPPLLVGDQVMEVQKPVQLTGQKLDAAKVDHTQAIENVSLASIPMVSQKGTKPKRMNRYKERRLQRKAMLALEQSKLSSKGSGGGEQSTNSEVMVLEEDGWPRYIPEKPIISNNIASSTNIGW